MDGHAWEIPFREHWGVGTVDGIQWNLSIVNSHGTQKNVHYTEVFTQEGWDMFMYTCACNTLKTVPSLLVRSSLGGRAIFQTVFLSFYILWFFWIFYESTCISYRLIVYHSSSIHSRRLDVHTMTAICKLNGIWPFHWSTTVMIGRQTKHYQPGTVLSSWECEIPSHYGPWPGRCEDKPSPACEHAVPSSRAELLIRTIAETNMALWAGQVNYDKSQGLI